MQDRLRNCLKETVLETVDCQISKSTVYSIIQMYKAFRQVKILPGTERLKTAIDEDTSNIDVFTTESPFKMHIIHGLSGDDPGLRN
ncbi:hypothetical protein Trydic_g11703 [Trypoxylus dichotomus]